MEHITKGNNNVTNNFKKRKLKNPNESLKNMF
jgi:hypothetical protein